MECSPVAHTLSTHTRIDMTVRPQVVTSSSTSTVVAILVRVDDDWL